MVTSTVSLLSASVSSSGVIASVVLAAPSGSVTLEGSAT